MTSLHDRLAERVRRHGLVRYDEVVDLALYDPDEGFYGARGSAGRRGDFITSPETGPLFGAVLASALDRWWDELGAPDPFVVVEAGAGAGTLARTVLAARPRCSAALTYLLVERSARLRDQHEAHLPLVSPMLALPPGSSGDADADAGAAGKRPAGDADPSMATGPRVVSLADLPALRVRGVVLANELLDNLAFRLLESTGDGWCEVVVGTDERDTLVERLQPADEELARMADRLAPDAPVGGRVPVQAQAGAWLQRALALLAEGRVVIIDYASTTAELAVRTPTEWLRTYRGHERGAEPLADLGHQDITVEVCVDQLARVREPSAVWAQAAFLREHGIDALVEEGRRVWHERAPVGDLAALRARSRVGEAAALLDDAGLGGFTVVEWTLP